MFIDNPIEIIYENTIKSLIGEGTTYSNIKDKKKKIVIPFEMTERDIIHNIKNISFHLSMNHQLLSELAELTIQDLEIVQFDEQQLEKLKRQPDVNYQSAVDFSHKGTLEKIAKKASLYDNFLKEKQGQRMQQTLISSPRSKSRSRSNSIQSKKSIINNSINEDRQQQQPQEQQEQQKQTQRQSIFNIKKPISIYQSIPKPNAPLPQRKTLQNDNNQISKSSIQNTNDSFQLENQNNSTQQQLSQSTKQLDISYLLNDETSESLQIKNQQQKMKNLQKKQEIQEQNQQKRMNMIKNEQIDIRTNKQQRLRNIINKTLDTQITKNKILAKQLERKELTNQIDQNLIKQQQLDQLQSVINIRKKLKENNNTTISNEQQLEALEHYFCELTGIKNTSMQQDEEKKTLLEQRIKDYIVNASEKLFNHYTSAVLWKQSEDKFNYIEQEKQLILNSNIYLQTIYLPRIWIQQYNDIPIMLEALENMKSIIKIKLKYIKYYLSFIFPFEESKSNKLQIVQMEIPLFTFNNERNELEAKYLKKRDIRISNITDYINKHHQIFDYTDNF